MNIGKHGNHARGDDFPCSKLTAADVRQMRQEYADAYQQIHDLRKQYSTAAFAERYGVDKKTIRMAIQGETWGHVK